MSIGECSIHFCCCRLYFVRSLLTYDLLLWRLTKCRDVKCESVWVWCISVSAKQHQCTIIIFTSHIRSSSKSNFHSNARFILFSCISFRFSHICNTHSALLEMDLLCVCIHKYIDASRIIHMLKLRERINSAQEYTMHHHYMHKIHETRKTREKE